jgi:hypothetical protein
MEREKSQHGLNLVVKQEFRLPCWLLHRKGYWRMTELEQVWKMEILKVELFEGNRTLSPYR